MKTTFIFLAMILTTPLIATEKDDSLVIAKGIQCTYLREKSFLDIYDLYSVEKSNSEYIKKVSDSIYAQAFKICDPENTTNADKEILAVCTTGCDQLATKGLLGMGGPSTSDIEKCKKVCLDYSDHLSHNYTAASKALKKYIGTTPPCQKEIQAPPAAPTPATVAPIPPTPEDQKKE
jgi:hypothetical protein